ncbi:hypothetical protein FACS1894164_14060 [Spirochaetia bacterium]|nr:hypothetical protein FACS1894164_14060 [Spirochaetia bacterium]
MFDNPGKKRSGHEKPDRVMEAVLYAINSNAITPRVSAVAWLVGDRDINVQ